MIGSLNRFRTLGAAESHYLNVAEEFWTLVLNNHTYVTGGNSQLEHFREPGQLDAHRDNTNNETCNSYNMMKLTRELFKVAPDVKYADFYGRGLSRNLVGRSSHGQDTTSSHGRAFQKRGRQATFWCCNGPHGELHEAERRH